MELIHDIKSEYSDKYEARHYSDEQFRITFHTDRVYRDGFCEHKEKHIKNNLLNENYAHWHEAVEILRIKGGDGIIYIGTNSLDIHTGDIIVINAYELHRICAGDTECVYDCLIIDYKSCLAWGIDLYTYTYKSVFADYELSALFDKLADESYNKELYYKTMMSSLCMQIMTVLTRLYTTTDRSTDTEKRLELVRKSMQYIAEHYDSQQILDDVSRSLQYSKFYLVHTFKKYTGMSVKEYQMQTRFSVAKKLLHETTLSVSEIANQCGYNNSASFTAEFKHRFSETPSQYRKK